MQAKIQAIQAKVQQCIALAESKFGIKMPAVQVRFDLRGRAAGMAGCQRSWMGPSTNFYLRFNVQHMQLGGQTWEHLLNDTVPHEVAHTVCQAFPQFGRNHDAGWKRVCIALGGNGQRCYGEDDAPEAIAKMRPYTYITTLGYRVAVTPKVHANIQRGSAYSFKGGKGRVTKDCAYHMTAAVQATKVAPVAKPVDDVLKLGGKMVTVQVKQPAPKAKVAVPAGASKADQLRAYLAQAKADVGSEAEEKTVLWAIATLGMTRTLARTYVKNNWNKV
jgi:predicted SprT family Zn-dependent metalloprotease